MNLRQEDGQLFAANPQLPDHPNRVGPNLQHEKWKIPQWGQPHLHQGSPQWLMRRQGSKGQIGSGRSGGLGSPISIKKGMEGNVPNRQGGARDEVEVGVACAPPPRSWSN